MGRHRAPRQPILPSGTPTLLVASAVAGSTLAIGAGGAPGPVSATAEVRAAETVTGAAASLTALAPPAVADGAGAARSRPLPVLGFGGDRARPSEDNRPRHAHSGHVHRSQHNHPARHAHRANGDAAGRARAEADQRERRARLAEQAHRASHAAASHTRATERRHQASRSHRAGEAAAAVSTSPTRTAHQVTVATGRWVRPVLGRMTSGYLSRSGGHRGVDLAAPFGQPIYAAGDGVVVLSGRASGFGNWIVIRHASGDYTVYGHQRRNLIGAGQRVRAGQLIALVGSEGQSTGPHLHFEVRRGSVNGPTTDPLAWLRARGVSV